jgi:hypothetical protein
MAAAPKVIPFAGPGTAPTGADEAPPLTLNGQFLLTEKQAADFLGFQPRTLQEWRLKGGGPQFVKISARAVRYAVPSLIAWSEERMRASTADPGPEAAPRAECVSHSQPHPRRTVGGA